MENLNDVEFGSDKNQEEAPILVAQRYLNIFRQIHIFSKEKRDQFDDELLALPQNILDFYKRMPGGRLLFEHIEDVKTERGISFVKMNKDDFSYDTGESSSSTPASGGGVPAPVVGGSVVMDASFAETLAQSMAAAFKGVPATAAPIATGATSNVAVSADFGNAFDIIAEEIRTSRASLLDVLKETRNITDTVIASQVSISRVLEGLLASKNRDETDIANLNNKIIASQASITKLLEGLYSSSTSKNEEISNYLNIDNKLQDFRNDLTQTIMGSLSGFADRASAASGSGENLFFDIESRLATFKNEVRADVNKSLSEIKNLLAGLVQEGHTDTVLGNSYNISQGTSSLGDEKQNPMEQISSDDSSYEVLDVENQELNSIHSEKKAFENDILEDNYSSENTEKRKKKKKKKKKNLDAVALTSTVDDAIVATVVPESHSAVDEDDVSFLDNSLDDIDDFSELSNKEITSEINVDSISPKTDDAQVTDAHDDLSEILSDLDSLDLSDETFEKPETKDRTPDETSPLDDLISISDAISTDEGSQESKVEDRQNLDEAAPLDDLDSISDITLSNEVTTEEAKTKDDELSLDNLGDLLNSDLSAEDSAQKEESQSAEESSKQIDVAENEPVHSDLDSLLNDENSVAPTPETDLKHQNFSALDDLTSDDDLDFSLPENNNSETSSDNSQKTGLDAFVSDDGLDFALPENSDNTSVILNEDDISSVQDNSNNFEEEQYNDSIAKEDSLASESEDNKASSHSSRYSAELDKIREALTSDNIDLASLDEPIALDDYSDDENVSEEDGDMSSADTNSAATANNSADEDWEYEYVEDDGKEDTAVNSDQQNSQDNGDWEWEYVDENGNPAQVEGSNSDEDWEWEYVEDDDTEANTSPTEDNNNKE